MIVKKTNKLKSKSKILALGLILVVLIGIFVPMFNAHAAEQTPFEIEMGNMACNSMWSFDMGSCLVRLSNFLFHTVPAFLLWCVAYVFNLIISITLYSTLYTKSTFIPIAWAVVRDLSNIFFILVLLYVAIRLILGIGSHEAKKTIVQVVIMALLINFSMFFTEVVIDSSNILALIFYNKVSVNPPGGARPYASVSGEKDVAGGLVSSFDVTKSLTPEAMKKAAEQWKDGKKISKDGDPVPTSSMIAIILITGLVILFAIYAFFTASISFIGRLIELWILIIFSPFAFMSSALPVLSSIESIGWDSWLKKLLSVSFMAPIFMFFLYLIFMIIQSGGIKDILSSANSNGESGLIAILLGMLIPAMILLALLLKAAEYAKKGGGQFGDMISGALKVAGGAALGVATGGAALAMSGTLGKHYSKVANNDNLKAQASGDKEHFAKLGITDVNVQKKMQLAAQKKLATANKYAGKSFDVRDTGIGKYVAKKSGMDLNTGTGVLGLDTKKLEGGRKKQEEQKADEQEKVVKSYELNKAGAIKQDSRAAQYEEDKSKAQKTYGAFRGDEEQKFKEAYEKGDSAHLSEWGITKKVEAGSVNTAKQENEDRRKAYAISLDNKRIEQTGGKEGIKGEVNSFFNTWKKSIQTGYTTKGGLAATLATGAATGGVGLAAPLAVGFVKALKQAIEVRSTDAGIAAAVRKGVDKKTQALKDITAAFGADLGGTPTHAPATAPSTPPAHTQTPSGGGEAHAPTSGGGGHHP